MLHNYETVKFVMNPLEMHNKYFLLHIFEVNKGECVDKCPN